MDVFYICQFIFLSPHLRLKIQLHRVRIIYIYIYTVYHIILPIVSQGATFKAPQSITHVHKPFYCIRCLQPLLWTGQWNATALSTARDHVIRLSSGMQRSGDPCIEETGVRHSVLVRGRVSLAHTLQSHSPTHCSLCLNGCLPMKILSSPCDNQLICVLQQGYDSRLMARPR